MKNSGNGTVRAGPIGSGARNTYLDLIRGVALLGIVVMNAVSFGLGAGTYFSLAAGGSDTWLDRLVGGFGEVFVDQKFMGLFSLLFGAGIALFCDRAANRTRRPALLSLWRNLLLLGIGLLHLALWEGDILVGYALVSPVIIALRNRRPRTLLILGGAILLLSPVAAILLQASLPGDGSGLGGFWTSGMEMTGTTDRFIIVDFVSRAVGMMLIGVALYRTGVMTGDRPVAFYRRMARTGLGVGLPLAALGLAWVAARDFSPDVAFVGTIPNTLGTAPAVLGYTALIILWNRRPETALHRRLRAAGRMALTNYLTQTLLGLLILGYLLGDADLTRTMLVGFIGLVWAAQLWWSAPWLDRFRYGPAEWLWRMATYRRKQRLRR